MRDYARVLLQLKSSGRLVARQVNVHPGFIGRHMHRRCMSSANQAAFEVICLDLHVHHKSPTTHPPCCRRYVPRRSGIFSGSSTHTRPTEKMLASHCNKPQLEPLTLFQLPHQQQTAGSGRGVSAAIVWLCALNIFIAYSDRVNISVAIISMASTYQVCAPSWTLLLPNSNGPHLPPPPPPNTQSGTSASGHRCWVLSSTDTCCRSC